MDNQHPDGLALARRIEELERKIEDLIKKVAAAMNDIRQISQQLLTISKS